MTKIRYSNLGFTLIEMAIVLVIAGLLLTVVIGMGNSLIAQSRISATKTKQEAIKTAILSYIARNSRMPCPAVPTIPPGNLGYGVEASTPGNCDGLPAFGLGPARVVIGLVPWISLGLSDEGADDGYYNRFTYAVTSNATNLNRNNIAGMLGNITIHTSSPITLGLPPLGNQSNDCSAGTAYNPCAVVAVIISHGINANGAYNKLGNQVLLPLGADESENTNIDSAFVQKDFSDGANPFDDILLTLNSSDLLSPLILNGSLQSSNAILADNFENITATIIANAISTHTTPGTPFNLTVPAPIVDPWGNAIQVTLITPSITNSSGGTAFTLTSNGPNSLITSDDIQVTVPVSKLMGPFNTAGW